MCSPLNHLFGIFLVVLFERRCQGINTLPKRAEEGRKSESPSADPHGVDEEVDEEPVAHAEGEEDAKVGPLVLGLDIERAHEVDARGELAVSARRSRVRVQQFAAGFAEEVLRVRSTRGSRGRVKVGCFLGRAVHRGIVQGGGQDAPDPVGGWVEIVQPVPPEN